MILYCVLFCPPLCGVVSEADINEGVPAFSKASASAPQLCCSRHSLGISKANL